MSNKLGNDDSREQRRAAYETRWFLDQSREQRSTYYRMVDAVKAEHARREGEAQGVLL